MLSRILNLGARLPPLGARLKQLDYRDRLKFLRSTSLVAHSWRGESQRALRKIVRISTNERAQAFSASTGVRWTTTELVLHARAKSGVRKVLEACEGLRVVQLEGLGFGLGFEEDVRDLLYSPNLAGELALLQNVRSSG